MAETELVDEAIRVVVSPSQASYFAGEPFTVTITITNLRAPQASLPPRAISQTYTHKRGAHSVSYVPMARPPTSPGIRTASAAPFARHERRTPVKRGIIGRGHPPQGAEVLPDAPEASKRRAPMNKSLSVSVATQSLRDDVVPEAKSKSPVRTLREQTELGACEWRL